MSLLVRLYPAAWRARYGNELTALLEDRPPGPFDVADLLLGALDAHLHLRGLGNRSDHRKGIPMSLRLAGYAAVACGALWLTTLVMVIVNSPAGFLTLLGAEVALLIALAGLSAVQYRRHAVLTWASFLVPAAATLVAIASVIALSIPGEPDVVAGLGAWEIGTLGVVGSIGGSILFGAVTLAVGAFNRTAAGALAFGALATLVGLLTAGTGLVGDALAPVFGVVAIVGTVAFSGGWIGLGIDAVRRDGRPVAAGPTAA